MSHTGSCWNRKSPIDAADHYCRHCGHGQGRFLQWYYRPAWIAVLTVTVLGPLSLFLVWRTPGLGRTARWIATVVIVGVTVYLGQQLWQTLHALRSLLMSAP
jgi:hypothetical protein